MSPPNLVQIGPRPFQNTYVVLGVPIKTCVKALLNRQQLSRTYTDPLEILHADQGCICQIFTGGQSFEWL